MTTEKELLAARQRLDELAAESRVLQEGSKAMRLECNEAWVTCVPDIFLMLRSLSASDCLLLDSTAHAVQHDVPLPI